MVVIVGNSDRGSLLPYEIIVGNSEHKKSAEIRRNTPSKYPQQKHSLLP